MQIFPRTLNYLPIVAAVGAALAGGGVTFVFWYWFSPYNLQVGYAPEQPIPYSHRLHAGELGIDCRYCHSSVESSQEAALPSTQSCMGCHAVVRADSRRLQALRESWESGDPVEWVRVHKLPEHAFFDHSVHVAAGVGCVSCHGRVDLEDVVSVVQPMSMGWCLECHRDPGPSLRPPDRVTDMTWQPGPGDAERTADVASLAAPEHCSGCHR